MDNYYFLLILFALSMTILGLSKNRNAWDILFLNSTLAIVALFMVGMLANNVSVWFVVAASLAIVATGEKIMAIFLKDKK